MALLFMDGCEHYNYAQGAQKWDSFVSSALVAGRFGQGLDLTGSTQSVTKVVGSRATLIAGAAVWLTDRQVCSRHVSFLDAATVQCSIGRDDYGHLVAYGWPAGSPVLLGTSTLTVPLLAWGYLEAKVTISHTGSIEIHWGGVVYLSLTGIDTQVSANATVDRVRFGTAEFDTRLGYADDFYICDTTGSLNNDFLGDVKVETLYPTGAGTSTTFTPSAGSNWQNVDDSQPNEDTDYNSSVTPGNVDTFAMSNLVTTSGAVMGTQQVIRLRKDDAGSRTARTVLRSGAANYEGPDLIVSDSYVYAVELREIDPATGVAYTLAGVNALEAGYKIQA